MFDKLKKKFGGWFGKKEESEEKPEEKPKEKEKESPKQVKETKPAKKEVKKTEPKKEAKEKKKEPVQKTKEEPVKEIPKEESQEKKESLELKEKEESIEEKPKEEKKGFFSKVKESFSSQKEPEKEESKPEPKKEAKEKESPKDPEEELSQKAEAEETPKEHLKEEVTEEEHEEGFFSKIKKRLTTSELTQEQFDEAFYELELTLLENNVALEVVDKIKEVLGNELVGANVKKAEADQKILGALKKAILSVLIEPEDVIEKIKKHEGTFVMLFCGINGSGKTTSIAKLAHKLKAEGFSCVLAAGDTFRAASIEQLETHAKTIGVPIVKGEYGKDPSAVAFDAIAYAKKNKIKVVLIDTAGRMYTRSNLMKEMEKIVRVANADLKIFVGESITGNDATEQAKMFAETAGIDGIILTKADVDEKAGTILSVSHVTGKPIYFLGIGQKYEDLKEFKKDTVLEGLGLN